MTSQELARKINNEVSQYPSLAQNLVKGTLDILKTEVKEGKALTSELLESEDKFFDTIAGIIDISTNTGIVDPFDFPYIRKFVERILRPILVRCFGDNWIENLRKVTN